MPLRVDFPLLCWIWDLEGKTHRNLIWYIVCFQFLMVCKSFSSASSPMAAVPSDWAVPHPSRLKYRQHFNILDTQMVGYLTGVLCFSSVVKKIWRRYAAFTLNVFRSSKTRPMLQVRRICTLKSDTWHFALDVRRVKTALGGVERSLLGRRVPQTLPPSCMFRLNKYFYLTGRIWIAEIQGNILK